VSWLVRSSRSVYSTMAPVSRVTRRMVAGAAEPANWIALFTSITPTPLVNAMVLTFTVVASTAAPPTRGNTSARDWRVRPAP
jgi:hypothetical protein